MRRLCIRSPRPSVPRCQSKRHLWAAHCAPLCGSGSSREITSSWSRCSLWRSAASSSIVNANSRAQRRRPGCRPLVALPEVEPPHHGAVPATGPSELQDRPVEAVAEAAPARPVDRPLSEQEQQNLTRWSNQVVSAHMPEAREKRNPRVGRGPESGSDPGAGVRAGQRRRSSESARRRGFLECPGTRGLAKSARSATRCVLAAADTNQDVADHAKEAYEELMRRDEGEVSRSAPGALLWTAPRPIRVSFARCRNLRAPPRPALSVSIRSSSGC